MKLQEFEHYEKYIAIQTETNKRKLSQVWASERELQRIAHYLQKHIPDAQLGICHGVRNGYEVQQLRDLLGIEVFGTEISDTATQFPHVIQWDFHEVKPEWLGQIDFIYSNSWDHSYDPDVMLSRWMSCLKPGGRCFLEWSTSHTPEGVGGADCFGISYAELVAWLQKNYVVESELRVTFPTYRITTNPRKWLSYLRRSIRVVVIGNR